MQKHTKNTTNARSVGSSQTVRVPLADYQLGTKTTARALPSKGQLLLPFAPSPESTKDCYHIIGEGKAPLGDAIPTNLLRQTH
jgi:hypothetical protein